MNLTILALLGIASAIHLLCVANFMPRKLPLTLGIEVALGIGFSVGITISALQGNEEGALRFSCLVMVMLLLFSLDKHLRTIRNRSEDLEKFNRWGY